MAKGNRKEKHLGTLKKTPEEALAAVKSSTADKLDQALRIKAKQQREIAIREIKDKIYQELFPEGQESQFKESDVDTAFKEVQSSLLRKMILEENLRSDGRTTTDIRNITIEQSLLPRAHGSSLFTRGETQTVAVCTLGGEHMAQRFEDLEGEGSHKFYLQYFFPPFSVGEVGKIGSPGRREIGHGKLAERAIKAALPSKEEFPYTIRLESNITESNGSSSMASVCGGCLALMDAGVPIKRPVAGIAMGLVLEDSKFAILSDILGIEDALGDMDFKVTGDHNGITAFQMDIKVEGITLDIMKVAITQARKGISHILNKMLEVCPKYNETMSRHAPRIEQMQIPPSKIGVVIGPGGKQIRAITEETGVEITIDDNGLVSISSNNAEGLEKAKNIIHGLTAEVEVKKTYVGKIVAIKEFGLFVEVLPGKQGLCHISEFDNSRIADLNDHVKVGDSITVKVIGINEHGQIKLSRKATLS